MPTPIPAFYLFGEPHRMVEDSFIHVESMEDRSRPHEWTIPPHSHAELDHIFFVSEGGGDVHVDAHRLQSRGPCLVLIPAGMVHGLDWLEETSGFVITLATRRLSDLHPISRDATALLSRPDVLTLSAEDAARVEAHVADLMRELSWARIGHEAAVQSALLAILVIALRRRNPAAAPDVGEGRYRTLVARLRDRIEERYRHRESIASHASALGTSETALRNACLRVAGISPGAMLNQRALLEAKRSLLFSDLSVGEIAYSLGFDDAAYFSRFFSKHVGQAPRSYRADQRRDPARKRAG